MRVPNTRKNPIFGIGMQDMDFPDCRMAIGWRTGVDCVLDRQIACR